MPLNKDECFSLLGACIKKLGTSQSIQTLYAFKGCTKSIRSAYWYCYGGWSSVSETDRCMTGVQTQTD